MAVIILCALLAGWSFVWRCRRDCETFPVYDDNGTITKDMETTCNELNKTYVLTKDNKDDGGCFMEDGYLQSGELTFSLGII